MERDRRKRRNAQPAPCGNTTICARWRLAYTLNELKKSIPFVRRLAVENMRCPYCYRPGKYHGISAVDREGM